MTPLEAYVNSRMGKPVRRRIACERLSRRLPGPLGNLVRSKVWNWPYRHMNSFTWPVAFEPSRPGAWEISLEGRPITTTVPLREWIGPIDRPVTIVAGGPSAREYPIRDLSFGERLVVAVNGAPAFLGEYGIRPDAWVVSDVRLAFQVETNFPHAVGVPLALPVTVASSIATRSPYELANRPLAVIERVNQWHGVPSLSREQLLKLNAASGSPFGFPPAGGGKSIIGWSHRPELGVFSGCTVVFAALQLMVGLGARDIEIIGMDLSGTAHVYGEQKGSLPNSLAGDYQARILPSFELMHGALVGSDLRIRNLSPVCPLPRRIFEL